MAFTFVRDMSVIVGEGESAFTLLVKKPKVTQLAKIYAEFQKDGVLDGKRDAEYVIFDVERLETFKQVVLDATFGWQGVKDKDGKEIPFSTDMLEDLVESDFVLFMSAFNKVMETTIRPAKDAIVSAEKN